MQRIVIIGAGLTGLSATYHLEQHGQLDVTLYEREETAGGLTRSVSENGFTFDYTGHFLHSNNAYFSSFLETIFAPGELQSIERNARVFINNAFIPYPFQTNISHLSPEVFCECLEHFIKRPSSPKIPTTFKQWLTKAFGKGMCKHFFYPYNRKILSYPLHKAMAEQGGRFVPNTSLSDILAPLHDKQKKKSGYNSHFLYPQHGGIQAFSANMVKKISNKPRTNHIVGSIDPYKKRIYFTHGGYADYDILISTMPLNELLEKASFNASLNLSHQATKLLCNTVINLNLGIRRPFVTNNHWMYFPESKYSFYRLGCWNAISPLLAPANMSSLYAEVSALYPSEKEIGIKIKRAKHDVLNLFGLSTNEICLEKTLVLKHAYVIYNAWRKENLSKILETLQKTFNIHSVGRFGSWKYSSMQEAILDGKGVAEAITTNAPLYVPQSTNLSGMREIK